MKMSKNNWNSLKIVDDLLQIQNGIFWLKFHFLRNFSKYINFGNKFQFLSHMAKHYSVVLKIQLFYTEQ